MIRETMLNKVDTKPQVQSKFDVTSFRRNQISQNFIVGTDDTSDHPSDYPSDHPSDHPSDGRSELKRCYFAPKKNITD
jgi:hypothetical protein